MFPDDIMLAFQITDIYILLAYIQLGLLCLPDF